MNKRISDSVPAIVNTLNQNKRSDLSAFLGFDACIDNIVRIVKDKKENTDIEFFNSSKQFGEFLINLDNKSCGVELNTKLSKIGGNMVITGNALGKLGMSVDCVGTFGQPDILPVFQSMSENCTLHTIGDTISATALEFDESKVIVFDPGPYADLNWEGIKNVLGIDRIRKLISEKQLISFLNWSEIENSSIIWEGFLEEILPFVDKKDLPTFLFTDFSDCSRKSEKEIIYAINLLARFRNYFKVIISLNQNETDLIASAIGGSHSGSDEKFIKTLFNSINADVLTIHRTKDAFGYDGITFEKCDTFFCSEPAVLTGGGDNFNAGFCYALLSKLDIYQSLLVANAVAGYYVKTGLSPSRDDLIDFLNHYFMNNSW